MEKISDAAIQVANTYLDASTNYCLFFMDWWPMCMTKSEWSGWMQAIGAILAILFSIWISGSQRREDRRNTVLQARMFAKGCVQCIQTMSYGLQVEVSGVVRTSALGLTEFLALSQSAKPELLPEKAMQTFVGMRLNATMVLNAFNEYKANPDKEGRKEFMKLLEYYGALLGPSADYLHERHNGVSAEKYSAHAEAENVISAANEMRSNTPDQKH